MELKENERIDDLQYKGLKIIQNKEGFCFGIDSVLLADFAKSLKKDSNVLDLGTGTGIISILLCGKTNLRKIVGVEIQEEVYDMAKRSVKLNSLEKRMEVINKDILELKKIYPNNSFDVIVTNPPYKKINTGLENENEKKLISRHEIKASLEDFIRISQKLLRDKGELYMVHRPDRLVDIFSLMRNYKIEPKVLKFVYPNSRSRSNLILIKGVKNAKPFLKLEENLYIYDNKGEYSSDIKKIYNN